ncbi:MAG TPA: hypothetical protein VML54_01380, partial [Candidatus Limnocylindrales bacterium]|nr:hypothetical protein [Candidatus Limnocylindrales bacterium]
MSSVQVRDHLVGTLKADLIGPVDEATPHEVLTRPPASFYLAGFLAPQQQRDVPPDVDDEELDDATVQAKDETGAKEADPKEKRLFPASLGLSVLLPSADDAKSVTATVSWADYTRQEEPPDPEAPKKKGRKSRPLVRWTRVPRGPIAVTLPLDERKLRAGIDVPDSRGLRLLGELGDTHDMPGLPPGTRALSLFLVNDRPPTSEKDREEEQFAFQVCYSLHCEAGFVPRANLLGEKSSDPDDRVADLQYRERREYAVGHGVSVETAKEEAGRVTRVHTTHLPLAVVRRVEARQLPGVTVHMDALAQLTEGDKLAAALSGIAEKYGEWIAAEKTRVPGLSSKERRGTATELLGNARRAQARIEAGVAILKRDPVARRAFCLMNEAMAVAARRREGKPDLQPAWRLFQLAFVLLNLEGLCDPTHDDRKAVDLIFFPTGGGKTEAYLGVIGFLLLHRRLTRQAEPDRGLGIAIILRYTLRLLTLDQLGRAATLICALDQLRQREPKEFGEVRFSLGLWVGQSATANTLAAVSQAISEYKNDDSRAASSPYPLTGCPWCRTPLEKDSLEIIGAKSNPSDVRVLCSSSACEYGKAKNPDGIPVLFVDEQIYHELPSFLIATVDKFA